MNSEMPQKPHDELESSLTALLLGELPHEQAAVLHQRLAQDADLAKLYERLKHTINLVRETVASPAEQTASQPAPLKLSDQRRQKLLQHFKTVTPKEFTLPPRRSRPRQYGVPWLVPVGIAAAFVVILGGLFLPAWTSTKSRSQSRAFGNWSRSEPAASVPLAAVIADSARDSQDPDRHSGQLALRVEEGSVGTPIAPSLQEAPPAAKLAGTAIVLPQAMELADAAATRARVPRLQRTPGAHRAVLPADSGSR